MFAASVYPYDLFMKISLYSFGTRVAANIGLAHSFRLLHAHFQYSSLALVGFTVQFPMYPSASVMLSVRISLHHSAG